MRIKIGIASANLSLFSGSSPTSGLLIVRTDADMIFYSPAMVVSPVRFIGTVHTGWITVPSTVNRHFSELRGKVVTVRFTGTCNGSPGGSAVQTRVVAGGAEGGTIVQQVRAYGRFQRSLSAQASSFIRTTPSVSHLPVTRPCAEWLHGVFGPVETMVSFIDSNLSRFR